MEQSNIFLERFSDFSKSLNSFKQTLQLDLTKYKEVELDLIKNGQIQKFEYSVELCWKLLKVYLSEKHGIETVSPKLTSIN